MRMCNSCARCPSFLQQLFLPASEQAPLWVLITRSTQTTHPCTLAAATSNSPARSALELAAAAISEELSIPVHSPPSCTCKLPCSSCRRFHPVTQRRPFQSHLLPVFIPAAEFQSCKWGLCGHILAKDVVLIVSFSLLPTLIY